LAGYSSPLQTGHPVKFAPSSEYEVNGSFLSAVKTLHSEMPVALLETNFWYHHASYWLLYVEVYNCKE